MPHGEFVFTEASPSTPGSVVSSAAVLNAASYLPAGVAGPLDDSRGLGLHFIFPANTTGGTLSCTLQTSPNDGVDWFDSVRTPSIANGAGAVIYSAPLSLSTTTTAPVVVGRGATPVLAVNTVINGAFSDRARLILTAGVGASSSITVTVRLAPQRSRCREYGGR